MPKNSHKSFPARWKYAAWFYLLITLISGTLLRYQWTGNSAPLFDSQFLLHGHSHLALLGWTFVGVFGGMFHLSRFATAGRKQILFEGFVHVLIVAMFIAFIFKGYAFWSILLSMSHILITFGLIVVYLKTTRSDIPELPRSWLDISLFWLVVSTIGPWMLSAGAMMGPDWIDFWVGYYLTLMFNGWLTFAVIGLLIWKWHIEIPVWVRDIMALGVLPAFFTRSHDLFSFPGLEWMGWIGAILFGSGLIAATKYLLPIQKKSPFWISVKTGMLLTGLLIIIGGYPGFADAFYSIRMLTIGFIHLQLIGYVSAGLMLIIFKPKPIASSVFLAGSWLMIGLLLFAGILQFFGIMLFWPLQWLLTGCGLLAITGVTLLQWR